MTETPLIFESVSPLSDRIEIKSLRLLDYADETSENDGMKKRIGAGEGLFHMTEIINCDVKIF